MFFIHIITNVNCAGNLLYFSKVICAALGSLEVWVKHGLPLFSWDLLFTGLLI